MQSCEETLDFVSFGKSAAQKNEEFRRRLREIKSARYHPEDALVEADPLEEINEITKELKMINSFSSEVLNDRHTSSAAFKSHLSGSKNIRLNLTSTFHPSPSSAVSSLISSIREKLNLIRLQLGPFSGACTPSFLIDGDLEATTDKIRQHFNHIISGGEVRWNTAFKEVNEAFKGLETLEKKVIEEEWNINRDYLNNINNALRMWKMVADHSHMMQGIESYFEAARKVTTEAEDVETGIPGIERVAKSMLFQLPDVEKRLKDTKKQLEDSFSEIISKIETIEKKLEKA